MDHPIDLDEAKNDASIVSHPGDAMIWFSCFGKPLLAELESARAEIARLKQDIEGFQIAFAAMRENEALTGSAGRSE